MQTLHGRVRVNKREKKGKKKKRLGACPVHLIKDITEHNLQVLYS